MQYFSFFILPTIITLIIIVGVNEHKEVYNVFCEGAKDGLKTLKKMFPTLVGIFLAISMFKNSGIFDCLIEYLIPLTKKMNIPNEIIPLMFIKPISGSASMALATDIMIKYGVDSRIGKLAGTIMSSSETTIYVIAIYLGAVNIKKSRKVIIPALIADISTMIIAILCIK